MSGVEFISKGQVKDAKKKMLTDFYLSYSQIEKAHPDQWSVNTNYGCWKPNIFRDYREFKLDELYIGQPKLLEYLQVRIRAQLLNQFKVEGEEGLSISQLLDVYYEWATKKQYVAGGNEYHLDLWKNTELDLFELLWRQFGLPSIPDDYRHLTKHIRQCYQSVVSSGENQALLVSPYGEVKSTCDYEGTCWYTGFSGRVLEIMFDQTTRGVVIKDTIHV